ncbi:MAG: GC-type dockerin domain-anchored protein [Phycisphaerales bacterium]
MKTTQTLIAALALSAGSPSFGADTPGLSYVQGSGAAAGSPGPGGASAGGYTYGWAFRPSVDITVTALAFPDMFAPGFLLNHTIFLWDGVTQDVLRTALAPAGAHPGGTMGANDFRYYSIAPITLTAGRTYVVGAGFPAVGDLEPSDYFYLCYAAASISFDPRITWLDGGTSGALNRFPNQWRGTGPSGRNSLGTCNFLIAPPPPPCAGDLNADNVVNTADLVVFLGQFGQTTSPAGSGADFTADGVVNTADLVFILGRFGNACP